MNADNPAPASAVSASAAAPGRTSLLTFAIFPVVMFGSIGIALALLASGLEPRFLNPLMVPPIFVLLTVLERLHPYQESWNRSRGDLKVDICYFFVTSFTVLVTMTVLGLVLVPLAGRLSELTPFLVWPRTWPLLLQVLLALLIAEFGHYWVHRLQHNTKLLWRLHSVHHSAPRLYWLNASRFHPLDMILSAVFGFGPLIFLGCPERTLALFTLIGTIHNVFQHANIELKLGPLNYVFSMAEMHRWHHSRNPQEANANYGGHLIFWDLLFGTRFLPKDRLPPEDIGLSDQPDFPQTLLGQLASPFTSRQQPQAAPEVTR
jgi:ornithine lipid hydroxylase